MTRLLAAYSIADENLDALPVRELHAAVRFYVQILGFKLLQPAADTAIIARDEVRLRLIAHDAHEPGRAGSVALETDDLDALHDELQRAGGQPGAFGVDEWDGRAHRTFFLREAENGYCYCFFQPR